MMSKVAHSKTTLVLAIKMGVVLALMLWMSQRWGHYYVEALLPLYRTVIDLVLTDYRVVSLRLIPQNGELTVAAHLTTIKAQLIDGHKLPVGVTLDASTLADHALKHLIIVACGILVWPNLKPTERGVSLLLSAPLLLILECIDIPLAIAGAVQDLVFFNFSSNYAGHKPLIVTWLHILDGGGRLALSVLTVLIVNVLQKIKNDADTEAPMSIIQITEPPRA